MGVRNNFHVKFSSSARFMFRKAGDVGIQDRFSSVNYFDKFVVHTDIFDWWISPTLRDREEFKFANVCLGWSNLVI